MQQQQKSLTAAEQLAIHEANINPFVEWRKGSRRQALEAMSTALRQTTAQDISHLSDGQKFSVLSPLPPSQPSPYKPVNNSSFSTTSMQQPSPSIVAVESEYFDSSNVRRSKITFGSDLRLNRLKERVSEKLFDVLQKYSEIGRCPVPLTFLTASSGIVPAGGTLAELEAFRTTTTFTSTKPPSRADAIAVGKALEIMHGIVDEAYLSKKPESLRAMFPSGSKGIASLGIDEFEEPCILDHLAVVDIGFAELIRQCKLHCLERGALLNHIRETLYGYMSDFLASDRLREVKIADKERELAEAQEHHRSTEDELAAAKRKIADLESELRRLETLHKYTLAKHIRDKQTRAVRRKRKNGGGAQPAEPPSSSSSSNDNDSDGSNDSFELGDTLTQLVRKQRELEPKVRRQSMANPLPTPSQFPQVRERQRVRVAEKKDVSVMTDPVFFRSKLPDPPKPPAVEDSPPPKRRERFASFSIAKSVTHNYAQTDPLPPPQPQVVYINTTANNTANNNTSQGGGGEGEPTTVTLSTAPSSDGATSVTFNEPTPTSTTSPRLTNQEIRRRLSQAARVARPLRQSVETQANPSVQHIGLQKGNPYVSSGTQTSLLFQLQTSAAFQKANEAVPTPAREESAPSPVSSSQPLGAAHDTDEPAEAKALFPPLPKRKLGPREDLDSTQRPNSSTPPNDTAMLSPASSARKLMQTAPSLANLARPTKGTASVVQQTDLTMKELQALLAIDAKDSGARLQANGPKRAAAALVKPLLERDLGLAQTPSSLSTKPKSNVSATNFLQDPPTMVTNANKTTPPQPTSSMSPPTKTLDQILATRSTTEGGSSKAKVRPLRWLVSCCMEVHFMVVREKTTINVNASTDLTWILMRHFRSKFGFEKVAEGYVADFVASIKALLPLPTGGGEGGAVAGLGTSEDTFSLDIQPTAGLGLYPSAAAATDTITLNRRVFAFVQFTGMISLFPSLAQDPRFNQRSYQFYLYILDQFRSRGSKAFQKELTDDVGSHISPTVALMTIEIALQSRLPTDYLEMYLLSVQACMFYLTSLPETPRQSMLTLYFPRDHHLVRSKAMTFLPMSDSPQSPYEVSLEFYHHGSTVQWDIDLLLEVLTLSYDDRVVSLILESRKDMQPPGGTPPAN